MSPLAFAVGRVEAPNIAMDRKQCAGQRCRAVHALPSTMSEDSQNTTYFGTSTTFRCYFKPALLLLTARYGFCSSRTCFCATRRYCPKS